MASSNNIILYVYTGMLYDILLFLHSIIIFVSVSIYKGGVQKNDATPKSLIEGVFSFFSWLFTPLICFLGLLTLLQFTFCLVPFNLYHLPFTLHHLPCTIYLVPCTLYTAPCTFYLLPCTLYLVPFTFYLLPFTF